MTDLHSNLPTPAPYLLSRKKRVLDLLISSLALVLLSPIWLLIAMLLSFSGSGFLFKHRRLGYCGREFFCYKFRTMVADAEARLEEYLKQNPAAEEEWRRHHKLKSDPRVTKFGKFLRASSLDEIPQLLNVLRGDMSLVGPRPITKSELIRYGEFKKYYLSCKPGVTGMWQVYGRSNTEYTDRVKYDSSYASVAGLFTDIKILFITLRVVALREGAY